jgi:hypothetical protein
MVAPFRCLRSDTIDGFHRSLTMTVPTAPDAILTGPVDRFLRTKAVRDFAVTARIPTSGRRRSSDFVE